uniref:Uncharacterized protein n=1 Tax=Siphoviridae sp. ctGa111 TaxID=2825413 RepID=A0A8S5VDE2_9CAUD|nr:MAG TPA: hypothetical protein [Siphoviridae sp. ctGa111]
MNIRLCRSSGLSNRCGVRLANGSLLCLLRLSGLNLCGLSLLVLIQFQIFCLLFIRFYI